MAMHNGVNPHTAADLLRQAMAQNSAKHESRDDLHDQLGSNPPTPSGVETPHPDLSDKRLPGIMHSYFGQVGSSSSPSPSLRPTQDVNAPYTENDSSKSPVKFVKRGKHSRGSSASSGSMVMVARQTTSANSPPLRPGEHADKSIPELLPAGISALPPTPISSASSLVQKGGEEAENGKPMVERSVNTVTRALRNLVLPKSSFGTRRHQSPAISSVDLSPVSAAHISSPAAILPPPQPQSPESPQSPDDHNSPESSNELSKLTSDATAESCEKRTPPLTPRTLSQEGRRQDKKSPLSSTSSAAAIEEPRPEDEKVSSPQPPIREILPNNAPRGKLHVKIAEGRKLRDCWDPYVVCVFEWNEYISQGPKHDAMDVDGEEKKSRKDILQSLPIRRTDSDMGKPVAIPMKSRQSSTNGMSEPSHPVNDPRWEHEAMFDVLGRQSEIDISIYDRRSNDAFLGHVRLCLYLSEQRPVLEGWFSLEPRGPEDEDITGEIHVRMHFTKTEKRHFGPNDFQILKLIGKGTFGQVYQVRKKDTQRIYAMKVLSKKVIIQKKEVAHTLGERNIMVRTAMAESPFIVGLKFSFQTPTDLYLVTDFMSGGELFWHLQKEGRFKEDRAKFYIAELILALQHLHQHDIVYRDLKPENILLDANGHIALCDFGLSKANLTKNDTTNTFCGTTEYLAPEVLLDEQGYTKMVDFWSLGVLVFEMCCGWSPFYAEDTQQMYKNIAFGKVRFPRDALSSEGRNFVKGLLNRNPKHRLGANRDAQELIEHAFFADVDWVKLANKDLVPPFKPKLSSVADTSNFDPEFTNALNTSSSLNARAAALAAGVAPASTPLSPTLQNAFRGFTFVGESAMENHLGQRDGEVDQEQDGGREDENMLVQSRTKEHRMSGVQKTGDQEGIFSADNWDM